MIGDAGGTHEQKGAETMNSETDRSVGNKDNDGGGQGSDGLTHEQAIAAIGPIPFNKNSFGFSTDPGFLVFIAVILDVLAIGAIWAVPQAPKPNWWMLCIPGAWILLSLVFWYIALKKRRWMKRYRELTAGEEKGSAT